MSEREIMILWDLGNNTADLADRFHVPEPVILRALHLGLERRRVQRVAEAIGANV